MRGTSVTATPASISTASTNITNAVFLRLPLIAIAALSSSNVAVRISARELGVGRTVARTARLTRSSPCSSIMIYGKILEIYREHMGNIWEKWVHSGPFETISGHREHRE